MTDDRTSRKSLLLRHWFRQGREVAREGLTVRSVLESAVPKPRPFERCAFKQSYKAEAQRLAFDRINRSLTEMLNDD